MRVVAALGLLLALTVPGCGRSSDTADKTPNPSPGATAVPRFAGLGDRSRPVSTKSTEAQSYFDQGLAFLFAFNHDEAIRSFRHAATLDPTCAMTYWGIALANGPHINNPVVDEAHAKAAWDALAQAQEHKGSASDLERALIEALATRYADPQPPDRKPLDLAYATAMRGVWAAHPQDADVGALFGEALMDLRPWDLWKADGSPQPGTEEVLRTLETVMGLDPRHPLANHLYIHAVEASPDPGRALPAADRLRNLTPGLGHLVHMPSHIDVRTGRWQEAQTANHKAITADSTYRGISPVQDFYRVYMAHNHHMLAYSAMMVGESAVAIEAINAMTAGIPEAWLREKASVADGFMAMPLEVLLRFGRWDDILARPPYPDYLPLSTALHHYARAVALAAKDRLAEARTEQQAFLEAKTKVPAEWVFGNNAAADLLAVAERFMAGEILYRSGKQDEGLAALTEAVRLEDALRYDEPPDWIQPVRHALGASLMRSGRFEEAEAVYRQDLAKLPMNGWSLFGLAQALRMQHKDEEATSVGAQFEKVWEHADVKLNSSCFCQPGA